MDWDDLPQGPPELLFSQSLCCCAKTKLGKVLKHQGVLGEKY